MCKKTSKLILIFTLMISMMLSLTPSSNVKAASKEKSIDATNMSLEEKPFSWDNANVYFVLTDRFYNGNTSNDHSYGRPKQDAWGTNIGTFHGGDIKGLTKKLEEGYFTELGTNAIWISAPWEQMHGWVGGKDGDFAHYGYHGYYGLDFTAMDKNMGTIEEMREFVDLAHEKGIRVILDVIMNHVAYPTLVDMEEFGYGDRGGLPGNWTPDRNKGENWHTHNDIMNKSNAGAWATWWGKDWIRSEVAGYDDCGGGDIRMCVGFLPDIKTEVTEGTSLPPILKTKWNKEATGYDEWIVPAAKPYRKDLNIAPKDYMVKWLSSWVEEFGIDGFRVDTAKHVEIDRWAELKEEAKEALKRWRKNNPEKPGAQWADDFWMTAEVFGHGLGKSEYFNNGFDSVINFDFQKANLNDLEGLFSRYARDINSDPNFNVLSYISSHDTSLYNRSELIQAGTALLLLPGGIQTFYGDETARPLGNGGSDPEQGTRSSMNWNNINTGVQSHWQKLGQFRNNHIAIGAGQHEKITDRPYTFARIFESDDMEDKVVVAIGVNGTATVNVGTVFADGEVVRDAYTGNEATVSNGEARFTAGDNGVILVESTQEPVTNLPIVSASPGSSTFKTEELQITLGLDRANSGKYTLDGSDPKEGTDYTDGTEITIGSEMELNEKIILKLYAENENGERTATYTYEKKDPNALMEVYFKKPANWSTPQLYFYETSPKEEEPTWATAPTMKSVGDDWYVYTFENAESARIIFKDSSGKQNPGQNQPGFLRNETGWFDGEQWLSEDPREPKEPATAPENLLVSNVTNTTATLTWQASEGYVVGYNILRDGEIIGSTDQLTYTDKDLKPGTAYSYEVQAKGEAGQVSELSNKVDVVTEENPVGGKVTIYYKRGFDTPYVHYRPEGGKWTDVPGVKMEDSEIAGYSKITLDIGTAQRAEVTFNNGRGSWDSNQEGNYFFEVGDHTYIPGQNGGAGTILVGKPAESETGNEVTIYYKKGFDTPYAHFRPEGGKWTVVPGVKMENSEIPGYSKVILHIGDAQRAEVAFNNGRGSWDSNQERNYFFNIGDHTYTPGQNGAAGVVKVGKP